jgi:hypothetical protein
VSLTNDGEKFGDWSGLRTARGRLDLLFLLLFLDHNLSCGFTHFFLPPFFLPPFGAFFGAPW